MKQLTITKPDDWHIHLRDEEFLSTTVMHAARQFGRAIVMPNLKPPITTVAQARQYRQRILDVVPPNENFEPLMTLYLRDTTTSHMIVEAKKSGIISGCKLYPAGSTTNSESGVKAIQSLYPVLDVMQEMDLPLLIHGEVTDESVDVFDREARFIEDVLVVLLEKFPHLRIVLEHITTKEAVEFVASSSNYLAATITAHHLLMNRNDLFAGGLRPHHYCLPVLKRRTHQEVLIKAATSGDKKFFAGTDSAPHALEKKETACGCAGIYTAHAALELYAESFDQENALDRLEAFCSFNGADFYKLPRNRETVTLVNTPWKTPPFFPYGESCLIPFRAGQCINWKRC